MIKNDYCYCIIDNVNYKKISILIMFEKKDFILHNM